MEGGHSFWGNGSRGDRYAICNSFNSLLIILYFSLIPEIAKNSVYKPRAFNDVITKIV